MQGCRASRVKPRARFFLAVVLIASVLCGAGDMPAQEPEPVSSVSSPLLKEELKKILPKEIFAVADFAEEIGQAYTGIGTAVEITTKFLEIAGFISSEQDRLTQEFAALHTKLDGYAGALSWQMSKYDRERRLSDSITGVMLAAEIVRMTRQPLDVNSPTNALSLAAVNEAKNQSAFERIFMENQNDGMVDWKAYIADRPDHPSTIGVMGSPR